MELIATQGRCGGNTPQPDGNGRRVPRWARQPEDFFAARHRRTAFSPDTARGEFLRHGLPELFLSADDEGRSCRDLPKCLPCRRRKILPDTEESSFHGAARLLRDFRRAPVEKRAFLTQRAAALHDTAQPLMRSFAARCKLGWSLSQRRTTAAETFHGAAFPAPLFSSEDERPRLQGKGHRSAVPLHALRRCLAACRGAEPVHQKPVLHRARGSRPQRRFRRNNGVRPEL